MKAIRVSEYGGPSVLKIGEVPTPAAGTGPGARAQPRRRREPGGHLPALEHRQPRAQAALHARLRLGGRGGGGGRRASRA